MMFDLGATCQYNIDCYEGYNWCDLIYNCYVEIRKLIIWLSRMIKNNGVRQSYEEFYYYLIHTLFILYILEYSGQ